MTDGSSPSQPSEREQLLALLLRGDIDPDEIVGFDQHAEPLSFAQRRLWFLNTLSGGSDASYNVPFALRLRGNLSLSALRAAFADLVARHDMLRASFPVEDGEPVQRIAETADLRLDVIEAGHADVAALISAHAGHTFVLDRGPLIDVRLLRLGTDHHILLLNLHHIIADGWSLGVLVRELSAFYRHHLLAEPVTLGPAPMRYSRYGEDQRRMLESAEGRRQLDFWLRKLSGAPMLLDLSGGKRPDRMSGSGGQARFEISGAVRDRLQTLSRNFGATLFMTLMGAFTVLLHRISGQDDILVGSPVAGRGNAELEDIVGCFVNTILIRSRCEPNDTFDQHLDRIRTAALSAYENQDVPFEILVEHLQPSRSLGHTPVFQVMMALQNIPIGSFSLPELTVEPVAQDLATAKFDLNLSIAERPDGLVGVLEFNADIFGADRAAGIVEAFRTILGDLALHDWDIPVSRLGTEDSAKRAEIADLRAAHWTDLIGKAAPLDFPREMPGPTGVSGTVEVSWSPALLPTLRTLCARLQTPPDRIIAAAVAVLLLRLTQQSSLVLGFAAGRATDGGQRWAGWHCAIPAQANFCQVVAQASQAMDAAIDLALESDATLAFAPTGPDSPAPLLFSASTGSVADGPPDLALTPLHFSIRLSDASIGVQVGFGTAIGTSSNASRLGTMLGTLLGDLLGAPDRQVTKAQLLTPNEREHVLSQLNVQRTEVVSESSLAEPFEACCAKFPHALAVIGADRVLSYRALDEEANRLAHYLVSLGCKEGGRIGIFLDRSVDMVVAIYAVAKVGAAYLPIDPALPPARIADVVGDASLTCIITQVALSGRISGLVLQTVVVDRIAETLRAMPVNPVVRRQPPNALAYLMYTSGSTGRPKAVQYPVDAAIASIRWLQHQYPVAPGDHHLFKTPYGFDVSIWEIFWPLYFGGTLVVCDPDGHRDPVYLHKLIERHAVTCVNFVPSMLQVVLAELPPGSCKSLRWVLSGGEALSPGLRDRCHALLPGARLVNLYGPTETHSVTDIVVPNDRGNAFVPLGRPSAAYRLYVLDEHGAPVPVGVTGELYIGGNVGLAHGYLDQPGLTADRFLPDPFGLPGGRMYRSGDLCRQFANGVFEHLGRADRQVKVRGLRIEPGEVEAALLCEPHVQSAVVVAIGDGTDRQLIGFVVATEGFDRAQALRGLASRLPRQMMPADLVEVAAIPLSVNGKVDHLALTSIWAATPAASAEPDADEAALSDTERRVQHLYRQVLGRTDIAIDQSFFEIGGHSMLTFRLMAACEEEFGIVLSMHALFTHDTVQSLAGEIELVRTSQQRSLVSISGDAATAQRLIFLIHGADGTIIPFRHLAKHLQDNATVYGFQAPGLDGSSEVPRSVEAFAERYVRAADQVSASARIVLIGWSYGGAIAIEMARIWSEQGLRVEATILLDAFLLGQSADLRQNEAHAALSAIDFLDDALKEQGALFDRLTAVLTASLGSFVRYRPQWFRDPVHLIKAREGFPGLGGIPLDAYVAPSRGWDSCLKNLTVDEVGADHFEMLSEEASPIVALKILNILAAK